MSEPSLMVAGRRRGRPPLFGVTATKEIKIALTDEQKSDLKRVAEAEGRPAAMVIRDAVNEYVADFRDRRVFASRVRYLPE